jgi:hypothetical protein
MSMTVKTVAGIERASKHPLGCFTQGMVNLVNPPGESCAAIITMNASTIGVFRAMRGIVLRLTHYAPVCERQDSVQLRRTVERLGTSFKNRGRE